MKGVLLLITILAIGVCDQYVPISKTPYGFSLGSQNGQFHIQAFLDLLCPDSKASYNALMNVMKTIDFQAKGIKLTIQHCPLPYHFFSFKLHQAFIYVQTKASFNAAKTLLDFFYSGKNQDQFAQEVLLNYSSSQFLDELSTLVSSLTKVNEKDLRKELQGFTQTDFLTRYHWKYSIEVHGIAGTPTFVANSVTVDGAQNFGFDDWLSFLQKYTK